MRVLISGIAGFIGFHLAERLAQANHHVVGFDNLNAYYDVKLKQERLRALGIDVHETRQDVLYSSRFSSLSFQRLDLLNLTSLHQILQDDSVDVVVHLAAQAGVRYSLDHPEQYVESNIRGFLNVLEAVKANGRDSHFIYASSSSVYGRDAVVPFSENEAATKPLSLYAASKRSDELIAYTYSDLYGFPTTGLRFFTVYGPWGRPDMAYYSFTDAIIRDEPINIYNYGNQSRDFTYIDDIIDGLQLVVEQQPGGRRVTPRNDPATPWRIYNIGRGSPVNLEDFVSELENQLNRRATKNLLPAQPGDVARTWADCSALENDYGYSPKTDLQEGISRFIAWFRSFGGSD